jgi:catechol 2,3-dioxygenase-like lactoylglutathione lyase family enzyme
MLLCLGLCQLAAAQSVPTTVHPLTAKGAFLALSVPDLDASVQWYTEKLDLRVVKREPPQGGTAFALLEGNGLLVELVDRDQAVPLAVAAPRVENETLVHGVFKAGVLVADFERTVALLRERQVPFAHGPFPARPDQRANVIVRDNAGNLIQFFGEVAAQ